MAASTTTHAGPSGMFRTDVDVTAGLAPVPPKPPVIDPRYHPMLERALAWAHGTHKIQDIEAACRSGRMQFWPMPHACLVTEVQEAPQAKVLHIFLGAAQPGYLHEIQTIAPLVYQCAQQLGCKAVTLLGRKGWARTFATATDGWVDRQCVFLAKEIP